MRCVAALLILGFSWLSFDSPAQAGTPDPSMSSVVISGMQVPCQFRFRPDGSLDHMLVTVTVNDGSGMPVSGCSVVISVAGASATPPATFCSCCSAQTVVTDLFGVAMATFSKIGGAGTLEVNALAQCGGNVQLLPAYAPFTSTDPNASCDATSSQTVEDDALVSLARPTNDIWIDYNCDGTALNVTDLAIYVGGTLKGCAMNPCP